MKKYIRDTKNAYKVNILHRIMLNYKCIAKTHRYIPNPQSHLAVLFHKYSPQHVSHDEDDDDDRRRCLEYSRRPRRRQSSFGFSSKIWWRQMSVVALANRFDLKISRHRGRDTTRIRGSRLQGHWPWRERSSRDRRSINTPVMSRL